MASYAHDPITSTPKYDDTGMAMMRVPKAAGLLAIRSRQMESYKPAFPAALSRPNTSPSRM